MNDLVSRLRTLLLAVPFLVAACGGDPAPRPEEIARTAPAPPETPAPAAAEAAGPTDPFGYYFLDSEKPRPAWAESIDHLHLSTIDMQGDQMVTVPLWGLIRPKSGDDFRLVQPELKGDHLTFTTQEVQGISYDFDGRFLASGNFPEKPPEGVVLKGRLRQLQGGKPAGEMEANFFYTAGD
jgi:hypothetical protein